MLWALLLLPGVSAVYIQSANISFQERKIDNTLKEGEWYLNLEVEGQSGDYEINIITDTMNHTITKDEDTPFFNIRLDSLEPEYIIKATKKDDGSDKTIKLSTDTYKTYNWKWGLGFGQGVYQSTSCHTFECVDAANVSTTSVQLYECEKKCAGEPKPCYCGIDYGDGTACSGQTLALKCTASSEDPSSTNRDVVGPDYRLLCPFKCGPVDDRNYNWVHERFVIIGRTPGSFETGPDRIEVRNHLC